MKLLNKSVAYVPMLFYLITNVLLFVFLFSLKSKNVLKHWTHPVYLFMKTLK